MALFGAAIASTDAAAVCAALSAGGAPEILSVMLEGESLLNDASSLTLFEIFKEVVESRHHRVGVRGAAVLYCTAGTVLQQFSWEQYMIGWERGGGDASAARPSAVSAHVARNSCCVHAVLTAGSVDLGCESAPHPLPHSLTIRSSCNCALTHNVMWLQPLGEELGEIVQKTITSALVGIAIGVGMGIFNRCVGFSVSGIGLGHLNVWRMATFTPGAYDSACFG